MAIRNVPYAAQTDPQMVELDQSFADVSALGIVPCTAAGTNALTLTPNTNTPTISAYADFLRFSFTAPNTSTGPVTVQVGGLGVINLFKAGTLSSQVSLGDVQQNVFYDIAYSSVLNSAGGGAVIVNAGVPPAIPSATGKLLQVAVSTFSAFASGSTQIPLDNSIPQNTEGDQYMAPAAFTATQSSATLIVTVAGQWGGSASLNVTQALFNSGSADALAANNALVTGSGNAIFIGTTKTIRPAGTNTYRFSVRAGANGAGTTNFNGSANAQFFSGVSASTITIMEVLP